MSNKIDLKTRLLARVDKDEITGCWIYRSFTKDWYGTIADTNGKSISAHRASYREFVGPLIKGMCVCHKCDRPACVNPEHLFLGTQRDNIHDCIRKGRKPNFKKGQEAYSAKLTNNQVLEIRKLSAQGMGHGTLAKKYNVSIRTVRQIVSREIWRHLPPGVEVAGLARCYEYRSVSCKNGHKYTEETTCYGTGRKSHVRFCRLCNTPAYQAFIKSQQESRKL